MVSSASAAVCQLGRSAQRSRRRRRRPQRRRGTRRRARRRHGRHGSGALDGRRTRPARCAGYMRPRPSPVRECQQRARSSWPLPVESTYLDVPASLTSRRRVRRSASDQPRCVPTRPSRLAEFPRPRLPASLLSSKRHPSSLSLSLQDLSMAVRRSAGACSKS